MGMIYEPTGYIKSAIGGAVNRAFSFYVTSHVTMKLQDYKRTRALRAGVQETMVLYAAMTVLSALAETTMFHPSKRDLSHLSDILISFLRSCSKTFSIARQPLHSFSVHHQRAAVHQAHARMRVFYSMTS